MSDEVVDVFEVECPSASASGWDFWVFRTLQEVMNRVDIDASDLEEGEQIVIRFKQYTPAQLAEVVYE